jgi:hypothetical protein
MTLKKTMTTPSVDSTLEVQFSDGTFVVPVYWAKALNRRTVNYINGIRVVDCSLAEMRDFVNTDALESIWSDAIRRQQRSMR